MSTNFTIKEKQDRAQKKHGYGIGNQVKHITMHHRRHKNSDEPVPRTRNNSKGTKGKPNDHFQVEHRPHKKD